jgi:hypothetical protein
MNGPAARQSRALSERTAAVSAAVLRASRPQMGVDVAARLSAGHPNKTMQAGRLRYNGGQDAPDTAGKMPAVHSPAPAIHLPSEVARSRLQRLTPAISERDI